MEDQIATIYTTIHLSSSSTSKTNTSSLYCVSDNRNLRFMNVNCRSLGGGKSSDLQAALQYIKPDIVFETESWLKGINPGKPPSSDAIQSSEVFPSYYKSFRNDRGTLEGGGAWGSICISLGGPHR
ncbi:hypothetical protein DPMN_176212 [Dreissena polymorpha]|uniref:Endonuclease/exonuclease/phosphatase domain-containing protein n=1 Tax=Dreissena polymorpha TaxID=45954 RepID=A0A9D4E6H9_DREPO|nr:hypothetical protein DPMN_176212 [Dreissena polymorpha]